MAERTFQEMINQRGMYMPRVSLFIFKCELPCHKLLAFDGADEPSKVATFVTLIKGYARAVSHETAAAGEAIIKRAYDHIKLVLDRFVIRTVRTNGILFLKKCILVKGARDTRRLAYIKLHTSSLQFFEEDCKYFGVLFYCL